jgi:hypothetical protein
MQDAFTHFLNKDKCTSVSTEIGIPAMHPEVQDACHGAHHLCSHRGSPVILQAGHHVRAKNNSPIFGVLTQPVPSAWNATHEDQTFIESSNIEFL